jgi:hypothetical protein
MRVADQARKVGDGLADERENVDIESAQRQIDSLLSTVTRHIMPLIRDLQSGPNAERTLGKAYSPEYVEPILRIEAQLLTHGSTRHWGGLQISRPTRV